MIFVGQMERIPLDADNEKLKLQVEVLKIENAQLHAYLTLSKENQQLKAHNERLKKEEATLLAKIQRGK